MAKIKHIAVATQDPEKTAQFYIDVFGLRQIARINSPGATGFHLTDGDINFAILKFKNDQTAGVPQGKEYTGLHHIGFEVADISAAVYVAAPAPLTAAPACATPASRAANGRRRSAGLSPSAEAAVARPKAPRM